MEGFREIFSHWELRVFIILSMVLQALPILWTYYHRRISSQPVQRILWLTAFLTADFVATLSLGAIFHLNINPKATIDNSPQNKYLLALWVPFILLHLGKHSRITTFSLAENEFWLSHMIRFIYHELIALFVCILASNETRVKFMSIILFVTGTIKFGERIIALKRGSMNELRFSTFKKADPGFSILDLVSYDNMNNNANIQGELEAESVPIHLSEDPNTDQLFVASQNENVRFLCAAYHSFNKKKGLYIDPSIRYGNGEEEGDTFHDMHTTQAFNLMEVELGFAYDLFYTKSACMHTIWGWIARFICLISILCAFVSFFHIDKKGFLKPDVQITYILLAAALILEMVSLLESVVSNRTKVQIGLREGQNWRHLENLVQRFCSVMEELGGRIFQRPFTVMGQFNMLSYCFNDYKSWSFVKWVLNLFELKVLWNNYYYTKYIPIDNDPELKNHIFSGVRRRLQEQRNAQHKVFHMITPTLLAQMPDTKVLQANLTGELIEFERHLLVWHFATELCYRTVGAEDIIRLQNAKYLSDYMMYLLAICPSMLSIVTTAEQKSYRNAHATCVQFYSDFRVTTDGFEVYNKLKEAYKLFYKIRDDDRINRNTLLWDGFELAYELKRLAEGNIQVWELLFEVWMDMLSFVAMNTHGKDHAERLGTGREFITYVWLFMVHSNLGSRYQFQR
ncbi:hypothetical protein LguiA_013762 [Lonicera macranthoides]